MLQYAHKVVQDTSTWAAISAASDPVQWQALANATGGHSSRPSLSTDNTGLHAPVLHPEIGGYTQPIQLTSASAVVQLLVSLRFLVYAIEFESPNNYSSVEPKPHHHDSRTNGCAELDDFKIGVHFRLHEGFRSGL